MNIYLLSTTINVMFLNITRSRVLHATLDSWIPLRSHDGAGRGGGQVFCGLSHIVCGKTGFASTCSSSIPRRHRCVSQELCFQSSSLINISREVVDDGPSVWPLPPMWETLVKLLAQPWLLQLLGTRTGWWKIAPCL